MKLVWIILHLDEPPMEGEKSEEGKGKGRGRERREKVRSECGEHGRSSSKVISHSAVFKKQKTYNNTKQALLQTIKPSKQGVPHSATHLSLPLPRELRIAWIAVMVCVLPLPVCPNINMVPTPPSPQCVPLPKRGAPT